MVSRDNGYGSLDDGKSGGRMGEVVWDDSTVTIIKPPGKGFGLAISGGVDRQHFDGDNSIIISDVLPGGPAEGKLKVNDRVLSVNGEFLDKVRHEVALNSLRKSGDRVIISIQRKRIIPPQTVIDAPPAVPEQHHIEIYKARSEGYGMRLGWKLYVQGLSEAGVAAKAGVAVGDKIDMINGISAETLSLIQVRKEIELSQENMTLDVKREPDAVDGPRGRVPITGYPNGDHITATVDDSFVSANPMQQQEAPPQRPPSPPLQDFVNGEPTNEREGDERQISYMKGKNVGLRLVGGNEVGIYVAAIQPGSQAESAGIAVGDRVKEINETDLRTFTKEDVILLLLTVSGELRLTVVHSRAAYRKISEQKRGDKFFIKTHFSYDPSKEKEIAEMSFKKGSVFRIVDTLPDGNMGYWDGVLLNRQNTADGRGLIPNKNRGEQIGFAIMKEEYVKPANMEGRGGFFKRRGLRASMSIRGKPVIKDHWDEVIFSGRQMKFPAYERVMLSRVDFKRPVVIFGPLADIARKKLIENLPDKFEEPITQHGVETLPGESMKLSQQGNVKLSAIKDIMDQQKHCLLDVTPNAVEHLNYHQLYPIVIFLNAENRSTVKAIRGQHLSAEENKGSRKLYQTSKKVKSSFQNIFTAMIPLTSYKDHRKNDWIQYCQDAIRIQQDREIWISESKFEDDEDDAELPVIGTLALPEGYDTDAASSYMSGNESQQDSDWEKEPTSPNESVNFTYNEEPEITKREVLPVAAMVVPPPNKYPSDDEKDTRKSRPRQKKRKKDAMNWARERSRSRSRDRRSEVGPISDEEDETDDIQNKDWRLIAVDRANQSWTATERPSRKEQQRKREEEKRLARDLARDSLPPGADYSMDPSQTLPVSQSTPQDNQQYSDEPERQEPSPVPLDFQPQVEDQLQSQVRYGVESAPVPAGTDYDDNRPTYQQQEPDGYGQEPDHYREDNHVPYQQDDHAPYQQDDHAPYQQDNHAPSQQDKPAPYQRDEPAPYRRDEPAPYRRDEPAPYQRDEPAPYRQDEPAPYRRDEPSQYRRDEPAPYRRDEPSAFRRDEPSAFRRDGPSTYRQDEPDQYQQDDPISYHLDEPDPYQLQEPSYQPEPYQPELHHSTPPEQKETTFEVAHENVVQSAPKAEEEDVHDDPAPAWGLPDNVSSITPPSYMPPPPPVKESAKPTPDPVYSQVQKPAQPTRRQPSPRTTIPQKPSVAERKVVSVTSSVVNAEVYKVDLENGVEDEDDYKRQLASVSYNQFSAPPVPDLGRSSPYQDKGRSSPFQNQEGRSSPKPQVKPKSALDPKKAREEWFLGQDDPVKRSRPGDKPYQYDQDSYRAYREQRNQRSKSPGRQYQEKTGIYAPKGWGSTRSNAPKPVPVSEEAFNSDEGQEVVATARGTFTSRGGTLNSPETGVSIKIPAGAIPSGISQEVYFKVCRDNNMLPPLDTDKGETLLSPLVMCGPHGLKFQKPVELNLPHTASNTPEGWSFNLKSSDTPAGETAEWKNMSISDKPGGAAVGQKTVSVMVEHF